MLLLQVTPQDLELRLNTLRRFSLIVMLMYKVHTHSCIKTLKDDSNVEEEFLSKFTISGHSDILTFKWLFNTVLQIKEIINTLIRIIIKRLNYLLHLVQMKSSQIGNVFV